MIIDNLRNSPGWAKNGELELYEFFECDFCGSMCDMPIEDYRKLPDDVVLTAKWMCSKCTTGERVERVQPKKPRQGGVPDNQLVKQFTVEQYNQLKEQGYTNANIARKVLKCSTSTFNRKLRELGISRNYKYKSTPRGVDA